MKATEVIVLSLALAFCSRATVEAQDALSVTGSATIAGPALIDGAKIETGDFRGASLNGVINCGGAFGTYSNLLSDLAEPSVSFATGDEDLYIQDVLEVGNTAYKPGGGSWATLSDQRLKKNIGPFTDGLSQVMQIRPVSFQYNERSNVLDQESWHIGVLAQDMLSIAPYMVREQPRGQRVREIENGVDEILEAGEMVYTFDPSALVYLLINTVQEQQRQIEELTSRIEAFER